MLTNTVSSPVMTESLRHPVTSPALTQKVAIVNGSPDALALVENVLRAGHYDVVFIESVAHAYSHIKRVQPNLVIICMRFEDLDTFQVLSMLKLDEDTRNIPVLTYTAGYDSEEEEESTEENDSQEIDLFAVQPGDRMN